MVPRSLSILLASAIVLAAPGVPAQGEEGPRFRRAEVQGNRLVLRGGDTAPAEAPAGATSEAPAEEVAGTAEAEGNPGAEAEKNAGAEREANAGAEAEKNAGAEDGAAERAAADARAEEEAEREAERRLLLRAPDLAAEAPAAEEAPIPIGGATEAPYEAEEAIAGADEEAADGPAEGGYGAAEADAVLSEGEAEALGVDDAAADLGLVVDEEALAGPDAVGESADDEPVDLTAAAEAAGELDPTAAAEAASAAAAAEVDAAAPGEALQAPEASAAGAGAEEVPGDDLGAVVDVVNQLNLNQQLLAAGAAALEEEQDAVRDRGEGIEASRLERIRAYEAAIVAIDDTAAFLAAGGGTGAEAQLASLSATLDALAAASLEGSGEEEAERADEARYAIDLARAQILEGDLFNARLQLAAARNLVAAARDLAETTAEPLFR